MMNQIKVPQEKTERLPYPIAKIVADRLQSAFFSFCTIEPEIVGSVRRAEAYVGDIELLLKPRLDTDMFNLPIIHPNHFDTYFQQWKEEKRARIEKNGIRQKVFYISPSSFILTPGIDPKFDEIKVELYIVLPPAQWGVLELIRTGPKEFSQWIVTQRKKGGPLPSACRVQDGRILYRIDKKDYEVFIPNEQAYFDLLGLDYIPPHSRRPDWDRSLYRYKESVILYDDTPIRNQVVIG